MTLLEIKTAAAAYHEKPLADLTQLGLDLGLVALNQAKQTAQLEHDFNFQRKMLTLSVNSVTGGSLDAAVIQGTSTTVDIKTIINIGVFDEQNNFRPVPWTTAEEGEGRMLQENRYWTMPWGARDERRSPYGTGRFIIRAGSVFLWPIGKDAAFSITIGIEAYVFDADWTATDLGSGGVATVTGTLIPNATGLYYPTPSHLFYNAGGYALFHVSSTWTLVELTTLTGLWHLTSSSATDPSGTYTNFFGASGSPVVTFISVTSDVWTTRGSQYLLWQTVVNLNKLFKSFVPRQEGNLSEPQALADAGKAALILWDDYKLEGFRTHGR